MKPLFASVAFFALVVASLSLGGSADAAPKKWKPPPPAAAPAPAAAAASERREDETPPKHDDAAPAAKAPEGDKRAPHEEDDELPAHHEPVHMTVGIAVTSLEKLDLALGTFNAEITVTVHCDREPCKPAFDVMNGKLVGKPEKLHDEKLVKKYKLKAELSALIDLGEYPFDSHELPIVLFDRDDPGQILYEIDRDPHHTHVAEGPHHIKLPGWEPVRWDATVESEDEGDGEAMSVLYFDVAIKRPAAASFAKALIPVLILLLVAGFQLLLKPKGAPARLSGSTATLTAAVMFHVGQLVSLPSVGYLTRLDKFMIATYLVIVLHIAFNVAMVRAEEAKDEARAHLLYLVSAGLVPGAALIAWVTVFSRLV